MVQKRALPKDPDWLVDAQNKTDAEFLAQYLQLPNNVPWAWTHPQTQASHQLSLVEATKLSDVDFEQCYKLIMETSLHDYKNSSRGWSGPDKKKEMRSESLRYILVKDEKDGRVRAFTSLMPTLEEGEPVVYCYEVHLKPELQGTGLGSLLMSFLVTAAKSLSPPVTKVMLTVFLSNQRAVAFYEKLGFAMDELSPQPRRLRGKTVNPDYAIMSKSVSWPQQGASHSISTAETEDPRGRHEGKPALISEGRRRIAGRTEA